MGKSKEIWTESHKKVDDKKIAKIISIPYDDLLKLEYKIQQEKRGRIINGYRIVFSKNSPKKITRLKDGNMVFMDWWELLDDDEFDFICGNRKYLEKYRNEIADLKKLNDLNLLQKKFKTILNRQIFISVIGAMETFLCNVLINKTFKDDGCFRNFIETHPHFEKKNFKLNEIFDQSDKFKETAKKVMVDTNYHRLIDIREIYRNTFYQARRYRY